MVTGIHKFRGAIQLASFLLALLLIFYGFSIAAFAETKSAENEAGTENLKSFSDIEVNSQLYPFVQYLTKMDIIKGFPDGAFRPSESVTRAHMAVVVAKAKGLSPVATSVPTFKDVPGSHWAHGVIEATVKASLFKGYPDGTFSPDQVISRAEAITILLQLSGGKLSDKAIAVSDVASEHWAYWYVVTAVDSGLVRLTSDNLFQPGAKFRRGDLARGVSMMLVTGPALRNADLIGNLTVKKGKVKITSKEGISREITGKTKVTVGTRILTLNNSKAEITFDDGSGILLEADTEIVIINNKGINYIRRDGLPGISIDKLDLNLDKGKIIVYLASHFVIADQTKPAEKTAVNNMPLKNSIAVASERLPVDIGLMDGFVSAQSKTLPWWSEPKAERVRVKVDMPWGVAGFRGTIGIVDSNQQSVTLVTGNGELTAGGDTQPINAGQSTNVDPNTGTPIPSGPMTQSQQQNVMEITDWVIERSEEIQNNLPVSQPPLIQTPSNITDETLEPEQDNQQQPIQQPTMNVVNIITQAIQQALGTSFTSNPTTSTDSGPSSPTDNQPPTVTNTDPVSGATNVPADKTIILTFSESIQSSTNYSSITVKDYYNQTMVIDKVINNSILTISTLSSFNGGMTYTVNIPAGAVRDLAGNQLLNNFTFTFTVAPDSTPLSITATIPEDNQTLEPINEIKISFNDSIQEGANFYNITLRDDANNLLDFEAIVSENEYELILSTDENLSHGITYTVHIPSDAVIDLTGRPLLDDYCFSFNIVPPLSVTATNPENNQFHTSVDTAITITFNKPIRAGSNFNDGIFLMQLNSLDSVSVTRSIYGNTLTITPEEPLVENNGYNVIIDSEAVEDMEGVPWTNSLDYNFFTFNNSNDALMILVWNDNPADLDVHLYGYNEYTNEQIFHVYYSNMTSDYAMLDIDITSGYGPEAIRIPEYSVNVIYRFVVHDYSNRNNFESTGLSNSGARVQVYLSGENELITYYVPQNTPGVYWYVFYINGLTGEITEVNTVIDEWPIYQMPM